MKVLWILNTPLPEARCMLTGRPEASNATGSWVCALADLLGKEEGIQIYTASPSPMACELKRLDGKSITHFVFPPNSNPWREIRDQICPDVVHIHGSEYKLSLDYVNACGSRNVVVSLQGLVSEIRKYYLGGIDEDTLRKHISLRDRIRRDTVFSQQEDMSLRGGYEIALLQKVEHVIGRTSWDKKVVLGINPHLQYHFCNEVLRDEFYSGCWDYENCIPHRIFVSQGYYPIKGAHELFEALPTILEKYPDTVVHIAGPNVLRGSSLPDRLLRNGYGRYLNMLIRRHHLTGAVQFIGPSDARRIKEELLAANVFVLSSIIENSPNSLCEAQMLGVPCVASDVGGVADLIPDASCGQLYPFGDTAKLAGRIIEAFEDAAVCDATKMRSAAASRHDRKRIIKDLITIYGEIAD